MLLTKCDNCEKNEAAWNVGTPQETDDGTIIGRYSTQTFRMCILGTIGEAGTFMRTFHACSQKCEDILRAKVLAGEL